jgi:outer membrane protein assembly factor BamE (lipoprotein component of BamABCDE complex)
MKNLIIFFGFILLTSCSTIEPVSDRNSALTQGNVQMNLEVGKTSKSTVLEKFGAPNITTRDGSGREVWTYQRAGQVSQVNSGYGVLFYANSAGFENTSRMITLIIKFDENDIISDFRSRSSNF